MHSSSWFSSIIAFPLLFGALSAVRFQIILIVLPLLLGC